MFRWSVGGRFAAGAAQDGIYGKDLGRNAVRWGERRHVAMTVATTGINLEELAWIFFNIHISSGGNSAPGSYRDTVVEKSSFPFDPQI